MTIQYEKIQYYKSWTSYSIPMHPTEPISYSDTEHLTSFYIGIYGSNDLLTQFTKYLKKSTKLGTFEISEPQPPGTTLYFKESDITYHRLTCSNAIPYSATEGMPSFGKAVVNVTGNTANIDEILHEMMFEDRYIYWSNGKLKERIMKKADGSIIVVTFDKKGTLIK